MAIEQDENLEAQLFEALREHSAGRLGTVLGTLILTEVDINALQESGRTALQAAFEWGCPDELRLTLIDSGADVRSVKEQIAWAAGAKAPRVLRLFIEAGADIHQPGRDGRPLQMAARSGDLESVRLLLAAGADVDAGTNDSNPLAGAIEHGHADCALALLAAGARPQHANRSRPVLGVAARRGMTEVVRALLEAGDDPNPRMSLPPGRDVTSEFASVFDSVFDGPVDQGNAELRCRSELPSLRYVDATPLIIAAGEGHAAIVRLLVEHGADVAATDADGRTAYDVADQHRQLASVIALLDGGANPHSSAARPKLPSAPTGAPPATAPAEVAPAEKTTPGAGAETSTAVAAVDGAEKTAMKRDTRQRVAAKAKRKAAKKVAKKATRKKAAKNRTGKQAANKKSARKATGQKAAAKPRRTRAKRAAKRRAYRTP